MKAKNWVSLLVIAAGLAYWGLTSCRDGRFSGVIMTQERAREQIRRTNERIGKLTVLEVSTKDIIYLRHEGAFPWAKIGQMALEGVVSGFCPLLYLSSSVRSQVGLVKYFMDPGNGVIYGHRGVLEYVVDLTQAKVDAVVDEGSDGRVAKVVVHVPRPRIDPMTTKLNLDGFMVVLRTKQFKEGDSTAIRMERLAKRGFENALSEIASMDANGQEAIEAARTALTTLYRSAVPTARIDVKFDVCEQRGGLQ